MPPRCTLAPHPKRVAQRVARGTDYFEIEGGSISDCRPEQKEEPHFSGRGSRSQLDTPQAQPKEEPRISSEASGALSLVSAYPWAKMCYAPQLRGQIHDIAETADEIAGGETLYLCW